MIVAMCPKCDRRMELRGLSPQYGHTYYCGHCREWHDIYTHSFLPGMHGADKQMDNIAEEIHYEPPKLVRGK